MSETLVSIAGLAAIALIVWWFWLSRPRAAHLDSLNAIRILVKDGAYQPAALEVPAGQALTLTFVRQDASPCAEKVMFAELGISADLPLNRPISVTLPALSPGRHEFTCQMGMYRGSLVAA
jgi:plastocyanin domain-containing protein